MKFLAEKPSLKVGTLKIANVFGMPVQELCIKWTALEGNVIFKLFVGRMDMFYRCNLLEGEVCTHVSSRKNEPFSCFVGKDKLHELFTWQELTSISRCSSGSHWCDIFCVKLKRLTRTCNAQACAPLDTYFYYWPLLNQGKMSSKQLIMVIIIIIKFSTSDNAFRILWLVHLILVISSYTLVWPYMVNDCAKLKMFSPESKNFLWIKPKKKEKSIFVESLDLCQRLEVCEKARNVFCDEPVHLSDHKVLHNIASSSSFFSIYFRSEFLPPRWKSY